MRPAPLLIGPLLLLSTTAGASGVPAEKSAGPAGKPAAVDPVPDPLFHDKGIHGQVVKVAVGQVLDVRLAGCIFPVAIGGDSLAAESVRPTCNGSFRFRGVRPGRTRVVLLNNVQIEEDDGTIRCVRSVVDFTAEVTGPGKAADAGQAPLLLFSCADERSCCVPVGRRMEIDGWTPAGPAGDHVETDGKSVRHDVDPKNKKVQKFTAVEPGRTVIRAGGVKVTVEVVPADKKRGPDAF